MPKLVAVNERGRRIGEDHPRAVLTNHEVDMIFELHEIGWGYKRLAVKFEVSKRAIRDILTGRRRGQVAARFIRGAHDDAEQD